MKKKIKILNLATKMIDAHPYDCFSALIKGPKGVGKSTYCIHGSAQVYYLLSKLPDNKRYITENPASLNPIGPPIFIILKN